MHFLCGGSCIECVVVSRITRNAGDNLQAMHSLIFLIKNIFIEAHVHRVKMIGHYN